MPDAGLPRRRGVHDQRRPRVPEGQRRELAVEAVADLARGRLGQRQVLLAAHDHPRAHRAGADQRLERPEAGEHPGAGVDDVEDQRAARADRLADEHRGRRLERELVGAVVLGDAGADHRVEVLRPGTARARAPARRRAPPRSSACSPSGRAPLAHAGDLLEVEARPVPAAAQQLLGRHHLRRQVHAEALDAHRALARARGATARRHARALQSRPEPRDRPPRSRRRGGSPARAAPSRCRSGSRTRPASRRSA